MRWIGFGLTPVAAVCLGVAAGCGTPKPGDAFTTLTDVGRKAPPGQVGLIVTAAQGTSGRVTSVNTSARYVVISYAPGAPIPPVEQRLSVFRKNLKVADVKITGPSRDTHTVADIISGDCQNGDEVRGE